GGVSVVGGSLGSSDGGGSAFALERTSSCGFWGAAARQRSKLSGGASAFPPRHSAEGHGPDKATAALGAGFVPACAAVGDSCKEAVNVRALLKSMLAVPSL